jgi:hypothetical protein
MNIRAVVGIVTAPLIIPLVMAVVWVVFVPYLPASMVGPQHPSIIETSFLAAKFLLVGRGAGLAAPPSKETCAWRIANLSHNPILFQPASVMQD